MRLKNGALHPALIPTGTYDGAAPGAALVPVPASDFAATRATLSVEQLPPDKENLDFIRIEASRVLTDDLVFSRESFRTYVDAYALANETVTARVGAGTSG